MDLKKLKATSRIGPHPEHIIAIIYGTLLGDSYCEKRFENVRISFQQENSNVEYLIWLWSTLSNSLYCTPQRPKLLKKIKKDGVPQWHYRLHTWTFSSFNYLYDDWYRGGDIKRVPIDIEKYLSPLALACWAMDDGIKVGKGFKFCTIKFLKEDIQILSDALKNRYQIDSTIQSAGVEKKWNLNIEVQSMPALRKIILPYMVGSMQYKLK